MPLYFGYVARNALVGAGTTFAEPAGFPDRTSSTISRVDVTRTFTIAPVSGSFEFWSNSTQYVKVASESVVWPNLEGTHFFYYDTSGVLQTTQLDSTIENVIQGQGAFVAAVYWDATNSVSIFFAEERHRFMPQDVHLPWHLAFGAQWVSGGALTGFTISTGAAAAHAQFGVSSMRILDEDLIYSLSTGAPQTLSPTLTAPVFYRAGANGDWRRKAADTFPLIQSGAAGYTGANGRIAYNQWTGTTWQLTEVTQGDYCTSFIFGTNDPVQNVVVVLGQTIYTTLNNAQTGITTELAGILGLDNLFGKELVVLGAVIMQTSTAYANAVKARVVVVDSNNDPYIDLRGWRRGSVAPGGSGGGSGDVGGPAGATDTGLARYNGVTGKLIQDSSVTVDADGNLYLNTDGSTTVAPRIFGAINFTTNEALRWEFGGAANYIQNGYGYAMQLASYHTLVLQGGQHLVGVPTFDSTSNIGTLILNVDGANAASVIKGASGQSANLTQWQNSGGTTLAFVDAAGNATFNGVAVAAHAARHQPGGADAISTAAPSTLTVGGTNVAGTATSLVRSDHTHALPAFGTGAGTFAQGNDARFTDDRTASGLRSATTVVVVSAATAPSAGQALVATSTIAATWQSVAALTAAAPADVTKAAAVVGVSTTAARADHKHDISTASVSNVTKAAAAEGTATSLARSDHKHDITTAAPSSLAAGGVNTEGTAVSIARSDHIHVLPAYGSGAATICQGNDSRLSDDRTASGLRSATTVVSVSAATAPSSGQALVATSTTTATWQSVAALTASAPANVTKAAAAVGVSTAAARADHKHDVTTAAPSSLAAGGTNTEGTATTLARADHIHVLPAYGTGAATICQGNDSRLSDDRTASGLRSATTVVVVSAATAPTSGQVLQASSGTVASWVTPSAGGPTAAVLATVPIATCNNTNIDVHANTATWGALIIPGGDVSIKTLQVMVYQASTGNVQGAIYRASDNVRLDTTDSVSVAATGLVLMTFTTAVDLTKNTGYYLAVSCTANGSRFIGSTNGPSSFNISPKPAFSQLNSALPATLNPSSTANIIWIAASPA